MTEIVVPPERRITSHFVVERDTMLVESAEEISVVAVSNEAGSQGAYLGKLNNVYQLNVSNLRCNSIRSNNDQLKEVQDIGYIGCDRSQRIGKSRLVVHATSIYSISTRLMLTCNTYLCSCCTQSLAFSRILIKRFHLASVLKTAPPTSGEVKYYARGV